MPAGRPTEYDPKFCEEMIKHFDIEPNRPSIRTITRKDGTVIEEEIEIPANFPTFASFARKIGVHRETLLNWCEVYPEFFDAYKRAKECQDDILTTNGLKDLYNATYGIFVSKNALDDRYKEKHFTDNKHEHSGGLSLSKILTDADGQ